MNLSFQPYNKPNNFLLSNSKINNSQCPKYARNVSFGNNLDSDKFEPQLTESNQSNKLKRGTFWNRLSTFFAKDTTKESKYILNQNQQQEKTIRNLQKQLNQANGTINELNNQIANLNDDVKEFKRQLQVSDDIVKLQQEEKDIAEQNLRDVISAHEKAEINPVKRAQILDEIRNNELNYNCMTPFIEIFEPEYKDSEYKYVYEDIQTGTNNRADMKPLSIPEIAKDGSFDFKLPEGEMKIKKAELKKFNEPFEIQSNVSEKYSNSLVWNKDKVARDLLQNFFDGHGQTLDGVKFSFEPLPKTSANKYRVRIEGKSTYNYKEAVLLGESKSHENSKAAGNYGEGLKMVTLKLLKQSESPEVKIGSGNWEVKCSMKQDDRLDSQVMNYKISPVEEFDGNYIEFETSDLEFLKTLRKSINRFYHSSNPHFKEPDFENDVFGFKVLPENEKGGIYIAGQRFQYDGDYDGIKGGVIFIKDKIPTNKYDMSRDRTSLKQSDICTIANWLADSTTFKDRLSIVKSLEQNINDSCTPMGELHDVFVNKLASDIKYNNKGAIKYPDNYAANILFGDINTEMELVDRGYKLFPSTYRELGMTSVKSLLVESTNHKPLEPTDIEKQKILLLKRALNSLTNLNKSYFTNDELDAKIYIFDSKDAKENNIQNYKDTFAEAIIHESKLDDRQHKGFWVARSYLQEKSFPCVFETAIHELSHKFDDDGTEKFGYKLTEVNADTIEQIVNSPKLAEEFRIYSDIWDELNQKTSDK